MFLEAKERYCLPKCPREQLRVPAPWQRRRIDKLDLQSIQFIKAIKGLEASLVRKLGNQPVIVATEIFCADVEKDHIIKKDELGFEALCSAEMDKIRSEFVFISNAVPVQKLVAA